LDGYNIWAQTYSHEKNPIKEFSDQYVLKGLPDLTQKKFLDVGCGTGVFCKEAINRGALEIIGVDLSPEMIKQAKENCDRGTFEQGNLVNTQPGSYQADVIVCALVLGHIQKLGLALTNLNGCLNKNGKLIITDFHPFQSLRGARRTFQDKNHQTHEILHYTHLFSEYHSLTRDTFDLTDFEEFQYQGQPVVFGMTLIKR
jgi:malonyl-CoA O-methyltransferase